MDAWSRDLNSDFNLKELWFKGVKLAKNSYPNKNVYSRYEFEFDSSLLFSIPNFDYSKNVIIFRVDMDSSVHINNKKNYILILGEIPTQWLDEMILV